MVVNVVLSAVVCSYVFGFSYHLLEGIFGSWFHHHYK